MRELRQQLQSALLMVMMVAAVIAAAVNLGQQSEFELPDDGVTWLDASGAGNENGTGPVAEFIAQGGAGDRAGIEEGDQLTSIAGFRVGSAAEAAQVLERVGPWSQAEYQVIRDGVEVPIRVVIEAASRGPALYFQYAVGTVYLAIGLYVFFRRGNAPRATHFFLLCLASFALSTFHYTGKLNNFDKAIYLGNVVAWYFAPTLFLHFCCSFPVQMAWIRRKRAALLLYLPGLALLGVQWAFAGGWIATDTALLEVRWLLDRIWLAFLCVMYLAGAGVLTLQMRRVVSRVGSEPKRGRNEKLSGVLAMEVPAVDPISDPMVRRQLTWLRNGAVVGIVPFLVIYAIPYIAGVAPSAWMNAAVISLALIPVTWAYAILRYRLMDVDIIFEQGAVYTLATLTVLGMVYGLIYAVSGTTELSGPAMIAMVLIAAFVFQPIRNWIREQLDRFYFYKDRYDYRRTLIEFARELGSPTDLHVMLETVADRLIQTLSVRHVAVFVLDDQQNRFKLELTANRDGSRRNLDTEDLDLSFLSTGPKKPYLFFERTRHAVDLLSSEMPAAVRQSIAELELTYYLPCATRGKTIAYLGVSRTESGDFLSSEDIQLLVTLSGYVGIAVENSQLYTSLRRKADEYERLKEFSENIVESIHVGILAADLENRVESWNSQLESLTGIRRAEAMGRRLEELLPEDLCMKLAVSSSPATAVGPAGGVQNIYKYFYTAKEATLNIASAPLVDKDGARIGRLIIFDDVTDRANLERRLVQADKLSSIGLLAAGVAHEVNTPLAVISTYAQMLAKQISGDEKKAPLLEKISRQTFRASEIVNSLLNFSRTTTAEFVRVDLNHQIQEALGVVGHQLQKSGIEVVTDLAPGRDEGGKEGNEGKAEEAGCTIRGNPGKLQQVLLNLFLNARDAMDGGGRISIATRKQGDQVQVTIEDTGCGIDEETAAKIFDPFFTTKGVGQGTGLGLSVSYGIVKEHSGTIDVESRPGQGTRFLLTFPEFSAAEELETIPPDAGMPRSARGHIPFGIPVQTRTVTSSGSKSPAERPAEIPVRHTGVARDHGKMQ